VGVSRSEGEKGELAFVWSWPNGIYKGSKPPHNGFFFFFFGWLWYHVLCHHFCMRRRKIIFFNFSSFFLGYFIVHFPSMFV